MMTNQSNLISQTTREPQEIKYPRENDLRSLICTSSSQPASTSLYFIPNDKRSNPSSSQHNQSDSIDTQDKTFSSSDSFYSISSIASSQTSSLATCIEGDDSDSDDLTLASETVNTTSAYHSLSSNPTCQEDFHNSDTASTSTACAAGDYFLDCTNCSCSFGAGSDRITDSLITIHLYISDFGWDEIVRTSENTSIWALKLLTLERLKTLEEQHTQREKESQQAKHHRSRSQHRSHKRPLIVRSTSSHAHPSTTSYPLNQNTTTKHKTHHSEEFHELNYGFLYSSSFLDEDVSFLEYFRDRLFDSFCIDCFRKTVLKLELRQKARLDISIMSSTGGSSTLPTSSASKKKLREKQRSKLLDVINSGNVEKIIKILVKTDPNFIDESTGETPLSLSASNNTLQTTSIQRVIVALVNGGALLDFRNREGRTALHVAVMKSNYVALKTFLDLGASPNYLDSNGLTPLFYSVQNQSNVKITQLLLYEHSIHGVTDHQGWQESHHAAKMGLASHLEQLLFYGVDKNARITGSGNTPLHVAAINDQVECARLLLLRGCDPTVVNNSHQNAYQVAVIAGNHNLAEIIQNHRPEQVVPYRDKPKYNPSRKPPPSLMENNSFPPKSQSGNVICPSSPSRGFDSNNGPSNRFTSMSTSMRSDGYQQQKMSGSSTLPVRGRKGGPSLIKQDSASSSSSSESPPITSYHEKTVSLVRGKDFGFGFVLRGAKASSHLVKSVNQPISLQYLDEIEEGGVAQLAGLEKGDFLLNVNGVDVSHAPHEQVVALIRQSGDKVTMSVATPIYLQLDPEEAEKEREAKEKRKAERRATREGSQDDALPPPPPLNGTSMITSSQSSSAVGENGGEDLYSRSGGDGSTTGRSRSRAPPPAPPKRDPSTTLTTGRSRTRSLCVSSSGSTDDGDEPPPPPPPAENGTALHASKINGADGISNGRLNKRDSFDSEGRSERSSISSNSIEAVIPVGCKKTQANGSVNGQNDSLSKTASIRSRGVRRLSGLELEGFLSRQNSSKASPAKASEQKQSQTLKRNKNKDNNNKEESLSKTFHSTGDIHQEVLIMQQQESVKTVIDTSSLNRNKKSTSQELLNEHLKQGVETVTLKNGKIVKDTRAPPPTHPPPPVPDDSLPRPPSSLLKSEEPLDKKDDTDYANNAQIKLTPEASRNQGPVQPMSSFKAPAPLPATSNQPEPTPQVTKIPPTVPPKQGILKGAKHLKQSGAQPSLYTRQPTMDIMDERKKDPNKLFVPEPDGSTSEEDTLADGRPPQDLKTFKAPPAASMTQSFHGSTGSNGVNTNSSPSRKSMVRSSGGSNNEEPAFPPPPPPSDSKAASIKHAIREFERRSSLTNGATAANESSVPNGNNKGSIGVTGSSTAANSMATSVVQYSVSKKTEENSNTDVSSAAANIRMSRSLYEVETYVPDGATTNDQSQLAHTSQELTNNANHPLSKVQTLNRRNSAVVSEKIANLIAQTHPHGGHQTAPNTQTLPSSLKQQGSSSLSSGRTLEKRVSIADPPEQPSPGSGKAAPTTAKTWSEISSAIKAVKGTPSQATQVVSSHGNRPISAPTAKQLSRHGSNESGSGTAELVPPPPEFAAPPPGQQPRMQAHLRTDPSTGQTHIIYKPQVKAPAPAAPVDLNRSTPPTQQEVLIDSSSAAARLGVNVHGQPVYRIVTAQQAQMLHNKHQQQQQALTQQQFATLSRAYAGANASRTQQAHSHQPMTVTSGQPLGSRSPQMQRAQFVVASSSAYQLQQQQHQHPQQYLASQGYQQYATLSRAGQKALASGQMPSSAYNDFTRLTLQNRLMRQNEAPSQQTSQHIQWTQLTPQQMQQLTPQQKQALFQRLQAQQQHMHHHHGHETGMTNGSHSYTLPHQSHHPIVHVPGKGHAPPAPPNASNPVAAKRPVSFPRKQIAEWSTDDVSDWLTSIGLSDYRRAFEHMNGSKLLRLDNNDLQGIGLKSSQHRVYVLDKIKQYAVYQQQHPPSQS